MRFQNALESFSTVLFRKLDLENRCKILHSGKIFCLFWIIHFSSRQETIKNYIFLRGSAMKIHKKKCSRMEIRRERSYVLTMFLFWELLKPSATPWCNGSTTGFGPVSPGSNPGGVATFVGAVTTGFRGNVPPSSCKFYLSRP